MVAAAAASKLSLRYSAMLRARWWKQQTQWQWRDDEPRCQLSATRDKCRVSTDNAFYPESIDQEGNSSEIVGRPTGCWINNRRAASKQGAQGAPARLVADSSLNRSASCLPTATTDKETRKAWNRCPPSVIMNMRM